MEEGLEELDEVEEAIAALKADLEALEEQRDGLTAEIAAREADLARLREQTETRFGFTVDYAGEISDRTAPQAPSVIAGGQEGDPTTVEAMWWAEDPDSEITGYRYAIGSAAGATDIVNWTDTSSDSLTRSGLGLVEGQQYWLSVQARNAGGLWSVSGYDAFVAGEAFESVASDFSASPISGTLPLEVTFTNQSTGAYTETLWHFGDGVTSTLESPTHTYTSAGVYTVTLDVSGPGGSDTLSRPNYITVEGGFDVFLPLVIRSS